MSAIDSLLKRLGFVKLSRYGLVLTPEGRVMTLRPGVLDDGIGGRVVGWQDDDLAAMELPRWEPAMPAMPATPGRSAKPAKLAPATPSPSLGSPLTPRFEVLPVFAPMPPPVTGAMPMPVVATTMPGSATLATGSIPPPAPPVRPSVAQVAPRAQVDEDEWEWEIALARARADESPVAVAARAPVPRSHAELVKPAAMAKLGASKTLPMAKILSPVVSSVETVDYIPLAPSMERRTRPGAPAQALTARPVPARPPVHRPPTPAPVARAAPVSAAPVARAAPIAAAPVARPAPIAAPPVAPVARTMPRAPSPETVIPVPTFPSRPPATAVRREQPVLRPSAAELAPSRRFAKGTNPGDSTSVGVAPAPPRGGEDATSPSISLFDRTVPDLSIGDRTAPDLSIGDRTQPGLTLPPASRAVSLPSIRGRSVR